MWYRIVPRPEHSLISNTLQYSHANHLVSKRGEVNRLFSLYKSCFVEMKSLIPSTIVHLLWAMTNQMTVTSTLKLISYPQGNPSSRSLLHTLVSQGKYNPIQLDPSAFYTIAFFAALGPLYSAHRVYLDADTLVFSFLQV